MKCGRATKKNSDQEAYQHGIVCLTQCLHRLTVRRMQMEPGFPLSAR
jgi:hypothetical protein